MKTVSEGDRVRIDIPDETDPDHDRYHGAEGTVVDIRRDDAADITGDKRDQFIYTVKINEETVDFR